MTTKSATERIPKNKAGHGAESTMPRKGVPRLAMINDIAGFGRCSTTVSLPIISCMQVQVCPVPTSVLSNHLGFSSCFFEDYTPHMREYLQVWKNLGISFDGLYCGFLGSVEQIAIVEEFLDDFQPPFFLLDPVMGDHGRAYSTISTEHCDLLRRLVARANLITPNITEACLLTDTPYHDGSWCEYDLYQICEELSQLCPGKIVITGLQNEDYFLNYIWQKGKRQTYTSRRTGQSRPGTGDIFSSILAADALNGIPLESSVQKASDFVALCIQGSETAGIPVKEGVLFEKYLGRLVPICQTEP